MSDFKKNNRFGGASRRPFSGSRPAGNRSFGGRPSSGGRDFGAQKELFKGECASCHKTCEVPFRPNGKKPIYCSDCFRKEDDRPQRDNRHERPFREERSFTPNRAPFAAAPKNRDMEDMKVQLASMNATLQKVLVLLQESHAGTVVSAPAVAKTASAPAAKAVATKRTPAKKAAPKKVSKTAKPPAPAPKKPVKKAVKKK